MMHYGNCLALFLIYNIIVTIHGKTDTTKILVYKPKPGALGDVYNEMKRPELDNVAMNFGEAVVLAKEEAKCLERFGSSTKLSQNNLNKLNLGWGCFKPETKGKCELCRRLTGLVIWKAEECTRICMHQYSFCNETCMKLRGSLLNESAFYEDFFHKDKVKKNPIKESATFTSGQIIQHPLVFCEAVNKGDNGRKHDQSNNLQKQQHYVQLKWDSQANFSLVYVVEQKTGNMAEWEVIGKTAFTNLRVNVAYHSETYRWRITAVGINGVVDLADIESYTTLNGYINPGPPKNVFIEDIAVNNLTADITIGWKPPKENTCFYKLVLANDDTSNGRVSTVRIREPLGKHAHTFQGLSLDASYDVRITSRNLDWTEESKAFTFPFETPSCLQIYNHSFAKCPPPPPKDIRATVTVSTEGNANLKLNWSAPEFTSPENPIEDYFVEIFHFRMKPEDYAIFQKNVEGNLTEISIMNIPADLEYIAVITAFSSQGASRHAEHHFTTHNIHVFGKSTGRLLILLALMLNLSASAVLLISFVATAMQTRRFLSLEQNRNRAVRNIYCKMRIPVRNVSRGQSRPNDNENPRPMKKFEWNVKWDIPWKNLTTQEIIGQGSFATVYKAQLRRDVNSSLGYETVALKVANEKGKNAGGDGLKMEIETLQRLSFHPQIVQLIGIAVTPKREVCLVLEYCGGGNLLNYLKSIREKGWTRLVKESLSVPVKNYNNAETGRWNSRLLAGEETEKEIEEAEETPEVVSYITPNDENAEEEEVVDSIKKGGCKMIVEKEILAFAKQIAMGMEYLASFNLLHLDLAARNILLMDDFRSVKIADFGLSRFITDLGNGEIGKSTRYTNLPIRWLALEAITSGIFSTKSDIWSFGILLWEMVTFGSVPYPEIEDDELVGYLQCGPDCRLGKPDFCSDELYEVMMQCWRENHNERPTFSELRNQIEKLLE